MNPWNQLLEALHSSLIDELCERAPEPKPELGMPVRATSLAPPLARFEKILACRVRLAKGDGYAALALDPNAENHVRATSMEIWRLLLARAETAEFPRRGIRPVLEPPIDWTVKAGLPPEWAPPRLVIWFPIGLNGGMSYLGVGK